MRQNGILAKVKKWQHNERKIQGVGGGGGEEEEEEEDVVVKKEELTLNEASKEHNFSPQ